MTGRFTDETEAALVLALDRRWSYRERVEAFRREGSCRAAARRLGLEPTKAAAAEREACARAGDGLLVLGEPGYPPALAEIAAPPFVLFVRGCLRAEDELALAVVGARRASPYGLRHASRLAGALARAGLTIVSGLARGIDGAAHRAALEAGGRSLAVLGSGLDRIYPPEHAALAERIAAAGAVLTELPRTAPPLARHFPRRNRIVAGLALGTLVVEATRRSGSLVSARHAVEQGREVFAVPGPVDAPGSAGVHALIQQGAKLVVDIEDILEELRPDVRARLGVRPAEGPAPPAGGPAAASPLARALLEALADGTPRPLDELAVRLGRPAGELVAAAAELEMAGCISLIPGDFLALAPGGGRV